MAPSECSLGSAWVSKRGPPEPHAMHVSTMLNPCPEFGCCRFLYRKWARQGLWAPSTWAIGESAVPIAAFCRQPTTWWWKNDGMGTKVVPTLTRHKAQR